MKKNNTILIILLICSAVVAQTNETDTYVEFDDRNNVVHGFYVGFGAQYGRIKKEGAFSGNIKIAYVANQKLEVGFGFTGLYREMDNTNPNIFRGDKIALIGGYGGFHIEPILFGKKFVSVSFPVLIGGGGVAYTNADKIEDETAELEEDDFDGFFVVEPGINLLYNFTRYTQLETGIRYRFTSDYELPPFEKDNLNGFSVVVGLKIGVFNLGRKKPVKDNF